MQTLKEYKYYLGDKEARGYNGEKVLRIGIKYV